MLNFRRRRRVTELLQELQQTLFIFFLHQLGGGSMSGRVSSTEY